MSGPEREDLLSEPPEYQSSEKLDTIGLETHQGPAAKTSSGRRVSSRRDQKAESGSASERQKREWAKAKVKNIKIIIAVAVGLGFVGFLCYIPIIVRNDRIAQLSSKAAGKRLQAAVNLGELRSGLDQITSIVRRCAKAEDLDGAPGAAALALAKAGDDGLARLKTLAEDQNAWARLCAAYGLGLTGSPQAVEALVKRLADSEGLVKVRAAKSLGMIRTAESVRALVAQAQTAADIRDAAAAGVYAIACIGSPAELPGRAEVRAELVKGLSAPTGQMRQACGRALIMLNEVPSEAELADRAASEDSSVKAAAVEFLGLVGGKLFDVIIPKALTDKSAEVRAAAASAAGTRRWAEGLPAIEKLATSAEEPIEVRGAAAEALGLIGKLESVVALAKAVTVDPTERAAPARVSAARALASIGQLHPAIRFTASKEANEHNDIFTHLKLSARKERADPRWAALEVLAAGCDSLAGENVAPEVFNAMSKLARRQLAPKPEVWKAWMAKKLDEAKALSRLSQLFEEASAACLKNNRTMTPDAAVKFREGGQILDDLRSKSDEDDKWFYGELQTILGPLAKEAGQVAVPAPAPTKLNEPAPPTP